MAAGTGISHNRFGIRISEKSLRTSLTSSSFRSVSRSARMACRKKAIHLFEEFRLELLIGHRIRRVALRISMVDADKRSRFQGHFKPQSCPHCASTLSH